jgi:hypothetical protein
MLREGKDGTEYALERTFRSLAPPEPRASACRRRAPSSSQAGPGRGDRPGDEVEFGPENIVDIVPGTVPGTIKRFIA